MADLLTPQLNEAQISIITGKTPDKYVKTRPGRGGKSFSYVEVGYVIDQLNKAFGLAWSWDIEDQRLGKTQLWVKGKLTIWFSPTFSISKSSFGGSAIKKDGVGNIIDVADDLKAASSDALKKAASMIGIAADVYFPQMDRLEEKEVPAEEAKQVFSAPPPKEEPKTDDLPF